MKRFTTFAIGAALLAGAAAIAAPASAQPYGYYPRPTPVCDPYSRFYDPFYCTAPGYGSGYGYGGPALSFSFGSGFHDGWHGGGGNNFRGGSGGHGGGGNWHGGGSTHSGGTPGTGGHGSSGGHHH